ncbi:MAG: MFS transporter [Alphaproteobacteria bacterium]|nr:MFS transporter [Alphaproteobacteria bacterium]
MQQRHAPETRHVSNTALHLYSLPNVALSIVHLPTAVYVTGFYSQNLGLSLGAIGLVILLSRLTDVFTDPVVGILSDRNNTSWGRRKPWILAGIPLMVATVWLLFVPPAAVFEAGQTWGLIYLSAILILYYLSNTFIDLPYKAWGADLSTNYRERSLVTGFRESYGFLGLILVLAIPVVMTMYGFSKLADWVFAIAVACAISLPLLFIPALWRVGETAVDAKPRPEITWARGLRIIGRNGPFMRLVWVGLFLITTTSMTAALSLLFVTHAMGQPKLFPIFVMFYYLASVAGIPIWLAISKRLGKHKATAMAIFWLSLWSAPIPFVAADQFWLFFALMMLKGSAVGALYFIPASMAADVIDIDTLRTGEQRTGLYFAMWGMVLKGAAGIGTALATAGAGYFAFDPTCASPALVREAATCTNTADSIFALAAFYSIIPAFVALAAVPLLWRYPVTEERQKRLRAQIARRNSPAPATSP